MIFPLQLTGVIAETCYCIKLRSAHHFDGASEIQFIIRDVSTPPVSGTQAG
jgi:hypothetical protein